MNLKNNGIYLTDDQRLSWLQLIRSENIGCASFWALIKNYKTARNALEHLPAIAARGGKKSIKIAPLDDIKREMEAAQRLNIRFICAGEPDFPPLLYEMDCAPPVISVKGDSSLFSRTAVAIVGSRNASAVGLKLAEKFSNDLSKAGFSTVSGFARGIDTAVHKASLMGGTIAVMAGGVDHIYPSENKYLFDAILDHNGVILSEMPLHFVPRAVDFPRRNRLIAGICLGLLVVEASRRSGSLITARLANSAGRHIFAIPGSPFDLRAQGTNDLIKTGATLVTETQEIIETLLPLTSTPQNKQLSLFEATASYIGPQPIHCNESINFEELTDADRARVIESLSITPIDIEALCKYSNVSLSQLYLALVELDVAGKIIRHADGLVSLRPQ